MKNFNHVSVPYDEHLVFITDRFDKALHELMDSHLEMIGSQLTPECWKWMCCYVTDLSDDKTFRFEGGDEFTRPPYMKGYRTRVFYNCSGPEEQGGEASHD